MHQPNDGPLDLIAVPAPSSWSDRLGPDKGRVMQSIMFGICMAGVLLFLVKLGDAAGAMRRVLQCSAVLGGALMGRGLFAFSEAMGGAFRSFIQPSGGSTPYETDYSFQESLAMRGDAAGALDSYLALIAAQPSNVEARVKAAELCARTRRHSEAARMLVELRRVPGVSRERDLYATSRLVDLLNGPLGEPGRALVELRRLADRHTGTREAEAALGAIARIKAERREH
jgi:hypothetical protein